MVSGDACVALGQRFFVLQRQRGASPATNRDYSYEFVVTRFIGFWVTGSTPDRMNAVTTNSYE